MGVTLFLAALLGQALLDTPPAEEQASAVVSEVELQLRAGADPKLLADAPGLVLVRKGQRLSVRGVRRSIERLMETGRFADVQVTAEETPSGLRVVFEIQARETIGSVYVEGNSALTQSEVLAAAKLSRESEFYPERLAQAKEAVLQAYRRKGYRDVQIEVKPAEGEAGIDVGFLVLEGLPTRLKGVVVSSDPGLSMPRLMRELGLELDEVLDLGTVEAGLDRVKQTLRLEHFYRAKVDPPQVEQSGLLVLSISAGPRIELDIVGNTSFASHALLSVLGWDGSELLDQTAADRLAQKLANFYRYRGFHDVRVTVREQRGPNDRSAVVGFVIDEGPRLIVRGMEFKGNRGIPSDELKAVLADVIRATAPDPGTEVHSLTDPLQVEGRVKRFKFSDLPDPAPETVLVEPAYLEAAKAMARLYHERGYLSATVRLEQIDLVHSGAQVRFSIEEGPQALLRTVDFSGGPSGFPEKARVMAVGEPVSERALEHWRLDLSRELARRGYLYGTVESELRLDSTGTSADLIFRAVPGTLVTVGKVLIRGNQRTEDSVVRAQVALKEGEPLDPEALFSSQRNLLGLGIFRSVEVRILSPEAHDAAKDVVVEVREQPRCVAELGGGYFIAEGIRGTADAECPNISGRAINLQARLRVNYFAASGLALSRQVPVEDLFGPEQFGGGGNVSVSNRGLLPFDIGARIDLVGERVFRQSYRFTRFAAIPGLDWSHAFTIPGLDWTHPKITLQLQYEVEWARVFRVPNNSGVTLLLVRADQERLRFSFGTFALHTVRFSPTIDLRDDAVVPRKGLLLQTAVETTLPIDTRDENDRPVPVEFIKISGTLTTYFPIWRKVVLAVSVRGGKIYPLISGSVTPPVKRFFLGGSSSIRGFREDGVIAEDQRQQLAREVQECKALASDIGCTPAARTLVNHNEILSQGGELFALGKAEVRFPAFGAFDVGVFVEAGNLWLGPARYFALRPVAGAGLRYVTPIGPLALDFGVNLGRDAVVNEQPFNVHFNIGLF
jgi:outer membrane protein insertion porin family